MKKTYQKPTALVVRVVTGNLMGISNIDPDTGYGTLNHEDAIGPALNKRMYGIEVE